MQASAPPAEVAFIVAINRYRITQVCSVVAGLGIPELLVEGPADGLELAARSGAAPSALHRLLVAAAALRLVDRDDSRRWCATPSLRALQRDSRPSLAPFAALVREARFWSAWAAVADAVRNAAPVRDGHAPTVAARTAAEAQSALDAHILARVCSPPDSATVIYVGAGAAAAAFANALHRHAAGRAAHVRHVSDEAAQAGLPAGADLHVLHVPSISKPDARRLLAASRAALGPGGRVVAGVGSGTLRDLDSLVLGATLPLSPCEWARLLGEAGMSAVATRPLAGRGVFLDATVERGPGTTEPTAASPPDSFDSALRVAAMLDGFRVSQAVHAVASLGLADTIAEGAVPVSEAAARCGAVPAPLRVLVRGLAGEGLLEAPGASVGPGVLGTVLRASVPHSMVPVAHAMGAAWHWELWGELDASVRSGRPAWDMLHGRSFAASCAADRRLADAIARSRSAIFRPSDRAIVAAGGFDDARHVVEIGFGGGYGGVALHALAVDRSLRATIQELPRAVAGVREAARTAGVQRRCRVVAGDPRKAVRAAGDTIVARGLLHNLGDDDATAVLRQCAHAAGDGGRVLVCEMLLDSDGGAPVAALVDLESMLLHGEARERSEAELGALLESVGLRIARVVATHAPVSILEAIRAPAI